LAYNIASKNKTLLMCMVTPEDGPEGGPPARGGSQVPAISLSPESRNGLVRGIALCATPSTNALVQGIAIIFFEI
jgi:hypothetical protein